MPPSPPSPFDNFVDSLLDSLQEASQDFLKDVNKQAKQAIKRQVAEANRPAKPQKRATATANRGREHTVVPPTRTLYTVLEVAPTASPETISAAFRSLSLKYHPDRGGNEAKYKEISNAWSVLKDTVKRRKYDKEIGA